MKEQKTDGHIKLYRKMLSHPIWVDSQSFTKRDAWIDLLLRASNQNQVIDYENHKIPVQPGELITSQPKLADRWGWSQSKVHRFLEYLKEEVMAIVGKSSNHSSIRIINYIHYQGSQEEDERERKRIVEARKRNIVTIKDVESVISRSADGFIVDTDKKKRNSMLINTTVNTERLEILSREVTKEVIPSMNAKTGRSFKRSSLGTIDKISNLISEGYGLDDIKLLVETEVEVKHLQQNINSRRDIVPSKLFTIKRMNSMLSPDLIEVDSQERVDEIEFCKNVLKHLNEITDRTGVQKFERDQQTESLILGLRESGYTLENFMHVIDVKYEEWGNNSKMRAYLRPTTLFGSKFKIYLKQKMHGSTKLTYKKNKRTFKEVHEL